jgi:hypothetical protein
MKRTAKGLALLLICGTALAAPKRYEPAAQQRALQSPTVLLAETRLRSLAAQKSFGALSGLADQFVSASDAAPLESEYLLSRWLDEVRALPPDPATRFQVEQLMRYEAKALTRSAEPHHAVDAWVPVFDIGSLAKGVLRAWTLDATVASITAALESGNLSALRTDDAEALELSFARAKEPALLRARAATVAMPARARIVLADRLRDAQLFDEIFSGPLDESVFVAIGKVPDALTEADARRVLDKAARRPELASAATLAMFSLLSTGDLIACLPDPLRGGSCAQLLARRDDAATVDRVAELARGDGLAAKRARLALQWNGSARARDALAQVNR